MANKETLMALDVRMRNNAAFKFAGEALDVETGTLTPQLTLGGVEITAAGSPGSYSTQDGEWRRIGRIIQFFGRINLSALGDGTGQARIDLNTADFAFDNDTDHIAVTFYANMASLTPPVYATPENGGSTLRLRQGGAAASATLSQSNFTGTANLHFAGSAMIE